MASRKEMLRRLALAVRGAALLSALVVAPGGALLAIPAVLRFINQVCEEVTGV